MLKNDKSRMEVLNLFHGKSSGLKKALCAGAFALCTAAMPVHADTLNAGGAEDGPWSDDLTEAAQPVPPVADKTFANLFSNWKKLDKPATTVQQQAVYIPVGRPVDNLALTSNFGVRSDPFNGHARMHKGIDIPGPIGTPVYATADGIVSKAQWMNGYGNLVEISHGNDTETRYGHLSKLIAQPNERVRRGQLIGLMGSTGRSTGSHLHYEIRVSGAAINPLPFVTGSERAMALNSRPNVALGGPTAREEKAVK